MVEFANRLIANFATARILQRMEILVSSIETAPSGAVKMEVLAKKTRVDTCAAVPSPITDVGAILSKLTKVVSRMVIVPTALAIRRAASAIATNLEHSECFVSDNSIVL